jgi:hypothetical protein
MVKVHFHTLKVYHHYAVVFVKNSTNFLLGLAGIWWGKIEIDIHSLF